MMAPPKPAFEGVRVYYDPESNQLWTIEHFAPYGFLFFSMKNKYGGWVHMSWAEFQRAIKVNSNIYLGQL